MRPDPLFCFHLCVRIKHTAIKYCYIVLIHTTHYTQGPRNGFYTGGADKPPKKKFLTPKRGCSKDAARELTSKIKLLNSKRGCCTGAQMKITAFSSQILCPFFWGGGGGLSKITGGAAAPPALPAPWGLFIL